MIRYRHILQWSLLLCSMLLSTACQNEEPIPAENEAALHIRISSAGNSVVTRGLDDLNDDGTVSEDELIVDGEKMYRLALFLYDGDKAVSSTVLEADDPRFAGGNTEAAVSFMNLDYTRRYRLYAVANYGNYGNLAGNLGEIDESNITSGLRINASNDNICSSNTPYPLSLTMDISLMPGENLVNGELSRSYARLRINIRNQSSFNDLYITGLGFDPKFTQQSADLFVEGGTATVSPNVTSTGAITPFEQEMMIPKIDDSGKVSEATAFDTYLLESTGGNYNYTLDLKYEGGKEEVYDVEETAINSLNEIEDGAMYLIYFQNSRRYLYANGTNVGAGTSYLTDDILNNNYVWKFNSTGTNRYTIESMGETGYSMQSSQISSSYLPLTVNPGSSDYFTASTSNGYIRLRSTRNNYYIAVNNSTVYGSNSSSSSTQRRYNLYLYKIVKKEVVKDITRSEKIAIKTIDKNNGAATPITSIKRNDFIDILVNVSYNEKSGNIEFEVSDWEDVEGDVTFD